MCIDICPVGALTSGTYRYKTRPWEMQHVGTICTHCSDGCKTTLGVRNNEIIRGNNRDRSRHQRRVPVHQGPLRVRFREQPGAPAIADDAHGTDALEPVSWSEALAAVAHKFKEVKARDGKFAVIGSNHTTNEENYLPAEVRAPGAWAPTISIIIAPAICRRCLDALSGKTDALATTPISTIAKRFWWSASDLSQQHPFLAFQIRANFRHHAAHIYTVTPGPVRETSIAVAQHASPRRAANWRTSNRCASKLKSRSRSW